MKKGLFSLLFGFTVIVSLMISCQHEPPMTTGCNGDFHLTYVSTPDTTGNGHADGTIAAVATGGTTITYSIDGGAAQSIGLFTGLTGGQTYKIVASNELGCKDSVNVTIDSYTGGGGGNPCPTITVVATGSNPTSSTAANGSISATATGGQAPYTYSINGTTYSSSSSFTGLTAGTYTIRVKDANNCPGTSNQVTLVGGSPCPTIVVTGTPASTSTICAVDGSITTTATGGTAPYTYSKNGTTFQSSGSFTGLGASTVTITAKDANGCTGTASVTVAGPATVHFATDVKPTINSYCGRANITCHNHSNSWTTYADIVGTSTGTTWTSNLNTFLKRIRSTSGAANSACPLTTSSGNHDMPPSTSTAWTNFVKTTLTNWVDQGYPNN